MPEHHNPKTMTEEQERKPKTDTLPRTAKKSLVSWLVPTLCSAIVLACFVVARSWADDRYTQKADTVKQNVANDFAFREEREKRENLERQYQDMNRKLDLIIYILQHDGKIDVNILKKP